MSQLTLELPEQVLERARQLAAKQKVSIEELISRMLTEASQADEWWDQRVRQGKQITRERILEILNKTTDVPPMPGDELP